MKAKNILLAAGFVLAGATAVSAESAYEPTNAVPNGLTSKGGQQILNLTVNPAGVKYRTTKRAHSRKSGIYGNRSLGYSYRNKGFGHILNNTK